MYPCARFSGRNDIAGLAVLQGRIDVTRSIGRIRRDLSGVGAKCHCHSIYPLGEAAGVMLFTCDNLDINHHANMVINRGRNYDPNAGW